MTAGDEPNQRIGSYEVFRKIGSGRIGDLYLAKQLGLDGFEKLVVLRRIHDDLAADQEFAGKLIEDARVVARLSHPNIVQLYDLGKDATAYFLAIEYVPGRNLGAIGAKTKSKRQQIPPEHVVKIASDVLAALHHAHTREDDQGELAPIVHRGVTPRNIIVAFSGGIKLADFGMTSAAARIARKLTGVFSGRYEYMSPEQVHGAPLDVRSDIFSMGTVLYEALAGLNPFLRENDDVETLNAIATEDAPNIRLVNPAISPKLATIVMRAMEKRKGKRWASAEELQGALDDYLASTGKRVDAVTLGKWVTNLFADELLTRRAASLVADAIVETGDRPAREPLREKPTEIVPLDETTIQPKEMFRAAQVAAAALETEIAPFNELPTAALIELEGEAVGFEVELSTLGTEESFPALEHRPEEADRFDVEETDFQEKDFSARDPADPARSRAGHLVVETENPEGLSEVSFSWQDALASLDMSTAEDLEVLEAVDASEKPTKKPLRSARAPVPVPEPAAALPETAELPAVELEDAALDPHAISRAFEAFSIDDDEPPKKKKKLSTEEPAPLEEPEPLPLDALQPVQEDSAIPPVGKLKRNIVEVHRPGPAAPTQFLSNAEGADGLVLDADALARLPEILRERSQNTPPPKIFDSPPKKKK